MMEIIEQISMWGGVAGVIIALFAIVILFFTRRNIINILDRDQLLFDKNFEMKKGAMLGCMQVIDYFADYGIAVRDSKTFITKAKASLQELTCVADDPKLIETFQKYCFDLSFTDIGEKQILAFKNLCREEMGLNKKISAMKPTVNKAEK